MSNVRIYNRSKQMLPIQVFPKNGDFYLHSQNIYLKPGKYTTLPKSYLNMNQINNLQANRMLQITHDSDK